MKERAAAPEYQVDFTTLDEEQKVLLAVQYPTRCSVKYLGLVV